MAILFDTGWTVLAVSIIFGVCSERDGGVRDTAGFSEPVVSETKPGSEALATFSLADSAGMILGSKVPVSDS